MKLKNQYISVGMKVLTVYYIIWLIFIVVFKMTFSINNLLIERQINLLPFYYDNTVNIKVIFDEMVSNILIFLPLGIMIRSILFRKNNLKSILFVFFFSLATEFLQYALSIGVFDITDIINNTLGGVLGVGIYNLALKKFKSKFKVDKFIFWIAFISAIFISLVLIVFLKYNGI